MRNVLFLSGAVVAQAQKLNSVVDNPDPGQCWFGGLNFDACCLPDAGEEGSGDCWDEHFSWQKCCKPALKIWRAHRDSIRDMIDDEELAHDRLADLPFEDKQKQLTQLAYHRMLNCIEDFAGDSLYTSMSGVFMRDFGKPDICHMYGKKFAMVTLGLESFFESSGTPRKSFFQWDLEHLQYGMCVPATCKQDVVKEILAPYYGAPFFGIDWDDLLSDVKRKDVDLIEWFRIFRNQELRVSLFPVIQDAHLEVDFYEPFDVLGMFRDYWLTFVLLLAPSVLLTIASLFFYKQAGPGRNEKKGIDKKLDSLAEFRLSPERLERRKRKKSSSGGYRWLEGSFPAAYKTLFASRKTSEFRCIHWLRLVCTFLVVVQHVKAFVKWSFPTDYVLLDAFLNSLARVNTIFVVIATTLLMMSAGRPSLYGGAVEWGRKLLARFIRQLPLLAFATWYFLRVTPEQELFNGLDTSNVWYQGAFSRRNFCARFPTWLVSHLFMFNIWQPSLMESPCHNIAIFESQFQLSAAVGLVVVLVNRILGGKSKAKHLYAAAFVFAAYAIASSFFIGRFDSYLNVERAGGYTLQYEDIAAPRTFERLLPAALLVVLTWVTGLSCSWRVFIPIAVCTVFFDTLCWHRGHIITSVEDSIASQRPVLPSRMFAYELIIQHIDSLNSWFGIASRDILFEIPLVVSMAAFLRSMIYPHQRVELAQDHTGKPFPRVHYVSPDRVTFSWVAVFSRLSFGANLWNIFALHFIENRITVAATELSPYRLFTDTLGILVISYLLSGLIFMLVEQPFFAFYNFFSKFVVQEIRFGFNFGEAEQINPGVVHGGVKEDRPSIARESTDTTLHNSIGFGASGVTRGDGNAIDGGTGRSRAEVDERSKDRVRIIRSHSEQPNYSAFGHPGLRATEKNFR